MDDPCSPAYPDLATFACVLEAAGDGIVVVDAARQYLYVNPAAGRLILASSLDRALAPLRRLQRQIWLTAAIACLVAVVACRFIAGLIARPIRELV